jgi:predicted DNA-binding WGR domain protein
VKLIKQTKLVFVEGRSEKVYEVDLCEVGANQFVVNFRYGKRGAALKDGSKTVAPVKRDEADKVFAKLVASKVEAGYVEEGGAVARPAAAAAVPVSRTAPPPPAPGSIPTSRDPRAQKVLERLAAPAGGNARWFRDTQRGGSKPWPLERVIWRAGELRIREATPRLIELIGSDTASANRDGVGAGLRDYCIAWALGRTGGPEVGTDDVGAARSSRGANEPAMRALTQLYGSRTAPEHVRRVAAESLLLIGGADATAEFKDHQIGQLPAALAGPARAGDAAAFAKALAAFPLQQQPAVLHQLYLVDTETTRPAVLALLATVPLRKPYFQTLRAIFKAAELRRDARVFGVFAYRFETTEHGYRKRYRKTITEPFSSATRDYLRRRTWRTLRRLGAVGDPDYVKLAAGVLVAFTDADAVEPRQTHDLRGKPVHWDRFAPFLAFNHVVYGNSARYALKRNGRAFRMVAPHRPGAPAPAAREEAFPALWEQQPGALMQLCAESACTPVHELAGKALLACPAFLDELELDDVLLLLSRPYDATARVGYVVATKRYDAAHPSMPLLAALAACAHQPGRARAFQWIDEQRTAALADSSLLAQLVLGRAADTRQFARRLLRSAALAAQVGQVLIGRLVAGLLALPEGDDAAAIAKDAVDTMTSALATHLATVSVAVIRDLLAHPLPFVQELGAELLLRHDARSGVIPIELILGVLHSAHENVRAVGLRLLGELPDAALATMDQLLLRLTCDGNADIRNASRPLVQRAAAASATARDAILAGLVESLLRRRLAEDVPSHVLRVAMDDLVAAHGSIDKDTILRLLASGSPHAQELGGVLLATNVAPDALELDDIVRLASNDILSVRRAAWSMYEHGVARVQANLESAVRILDAKWQDSRDWGFAFFRRPELRFTADVLVAITDSVRDDVQAFGREMLQKHFSDADGPHVLARLAEHPSRSVQLFATNYLERFAAGQPEKLAPLVPYFASVLSRVNQGRVAKQRVLAFLQSEGARDTSAANVVIPLLHRIAATISVEYRAGAIEAMMAIHRARPDAALPLKVAATEVR